MVTNLMPAPFLTLSDLSVRAIIKLYRLTDISAKVSEILSTFLFLIACVHPSV